jgi:hypothetical protein
MLRVEKVAMMFRLKWWNTKVAKYSTGLKWKERPK